MARAAARRAAILAATIAGTLASACAVRYDSAGVTRVGVGLWGLGDPPGVDWNLDWPRREVPELPRTPPAELPPRPQPPADPLRFEWLAPVTGQSSPIDDNRGCGSRCASSPPSGPHPAGARAGSGAAVR